MKKGARKGTAIAAIILAPVAWLIAIIVSVVVIVGSAGDAGGGSSSSDGAPSTSRTAPGDEPAAADAGGEAAIGDTLTNKDGVAVTFTSVSCGIPVAGPQYFEETAKGQFCEVRFQVQNGSDAEISLFASDITGLIGSAEYAASDTISTFGDESFFTELNPGLGTEGVVFIDIPADAALDSVVYRPMWAFLTDEIRVRVS